MPSPPPIRSRHVCTFESRRADEMRSLIERFGGTPLVAPSMQEVPVDSNTTAVAAIQRIVAGDVSHLILLTGVGTEAMLTVAESCNLQQPLLEAMRQLPLLVRGPKPAAALSKRKLKYTVKAPEPNTYHDLLQAIDDANIDLNGQSVAVQEYGIASPELYAALEQRGATVMPVPVYQWALPDDIEPLKAAITATIRGDLDALLFTSAQQVRHVLQVADQMQQRSAWLTAANNCLVASIGPTCSQTMTAEGIRVSFEASPPKMGPLVRGVMDALRTVV